MTNSVYYLFVYVHLFTFTSFLCLNVYWNFPCLNSKYCQCVYLLILLEVLMRSLGRSVFVVVWKNIAPTSSYRMALLGSGLVTVGVALLEDVIDQVIIVLMCFYCRIHSALWGTRGCSQLGRHMWELDLAICSKTGLCCVSVWNCVHPLLCNSKQENPRRVSMGLSTGSIKSLRGFTFNVSILAHSNFPYCQQFSLPQAFICLILFFIIQSMPPTLVRYLSCCLRTLFPQRSPSLFSKLIDPGGPMPSSDLPGEHTTYAHTHTHTVHR